MLAELLSLMALAAGITMVASLIHPCTGCSKLPAKVRVASDLRSSKDQSSDTVVLDKLSWLFLTLGSVATAK